MRTTVNTDYARRDQARSASHSGCDRFVGWLANQVLRLASTRYRAMIGGAIGTAVRPRVHAHGYCDGCDEDCEFGPCCILDR